MAKKERFIAPRRFGDVVQWYPMGDKNEAPWLGLVTRVDSQGGLDLSLVERETRTFSFVTSCRHVRDPYLKQHPQHAVENGGWDTSPLDRKVAELAYSLKTSQKPNSGTAGK